jgi:hypothetical protein
VTQNDQRPLALVCNMHLNAVCFDEPVTSRCHNYPIQPQTYRSPISLLDVRREILLNSPSTNPLCGYSGGFLLLHRSLLAVASLMRTPQSFIPPSPPAAPKAYIVSAICSNCVTDGAGCTTRLSIYRASAWHGSTSSAARSPERLFTQSRAI